MMKSQHMVGGVALWGGACAVFSPPPVAALAGVPVAAYLALWPDIENEQSTAARWLGPVTYRLALRLRRRYGHRGPVHSLFAGVPVCAGLATVGAMVVGLVAVAASSVTVAVLLPLAGMSAASSLMGAASHPLLDFFTCDCAYCHDHNGLYDRAAATIGRWWNGEFPFTVRRHVNKSGKSAPGSALLWPLVKRRIGLPLMIVGGPGERRVVRPVLVSLAGVAAVFTVMGW